MAAYRCGNCNLSYPHGEPNKCPICGATAYYRGDLNPDQDWEARVEIAASKTLEGSPSQEWRFEWFRRMGFGPALSAVLADCREITPRDVQERLIDKGCPTDLAARILL